MALGAQAAVSHACEGGDDRRQAGPRRADKAAQLREDGEFEVPPIDPPLAVDHVGAPLRSDEIDAGAPGQVSALALAQPPE